MVSVYLLRLHSCARCTRFAVNHPRWVHCCWQCRDEVRHEGEILHTPECQSRQESLERLLADHGEFVQEEEQEVYEA